MILLLYCIKLKKIEIIQFDLCSILLYIRNLKTYFFRNLFSMLISWLVLFFTRILIQFPRGTTERQ